MRRKVLVKTALIELKAKYEKTLSKYRKNLNDYVGNNYQVRERTGVRGGRATTIVGKIDQKIMLIEQLKSNIKILEEEIEKL